MRKNRKNLSVLFSLAAFSLLLGACAATPANHDAANAREISSVGNEESDYGVWEKRAHKPKLRHEY